MDALGSSSSSNNVPPPPQRQQAPMEQQQHRRQPMQVPPCVHNRVGSMASSSSSHSLIRRDEDEQHQQGRRTRRRLDTASYESSSGSSSSWWWQNGGVFIKQQLQQQTEQQQQYGQQIPQQQIQQAEQKSPDMDCRLWSNLPDDLIERVLAWIPAPAFFRFRTVCKRWRTIMYSPGFVDMAAASRSSGGAAAPFFLKMARCRCRMLAAYYPAGNRWLNIPIGFLPSQVSVPAAASRGLMCFIATHFVDGYSVLLVCNPLTRCWKALPPMITRRYPFVVSLVADRNLRAYKVVVAGDYNSFDNRRTTEVYDSVTSTWKLSGPLPREEEITKNMVACNGYLFCLSRGPGNGLLAYNLQQEIWIKVRTGRMPGYSKFRHLVECGGRIIIVGKALRRQVLGLYIWHLEPASMKWRELARMPQLLSQQFFRTPSECFFCAAHGDQIFISRFFCDLGLLYNITHDTWQWITDCPRIANPFILTLEPGFDAVY